MSKLTGLTRLAGLTTAALEFQTTQVGSLGTDNGSATSFGGGSTPAQPYRVKANVTLFVPHPTDADKGFIQAGGVSIEGEGSTLTIAQDSAAERAANYLGL